MESVESVCGRLYSIVKVPSQRGGGYSNSLSEFIFQSCYLLAVGLLTRI